MAGDGVLETTQSRTESSVQEFGREDRIWMPFAKKFARSEQEDPITELRRKIEVMERHKGSSCSSPL